MIIGIAGQPGLTRNYIEAIRSAADRAVFPPSAPPAASPFMRHVQLQHGQGAEIEVSLSPGRAARWDALVLPGGGDIDPALLPDKPSPDPRCHDIDPVLDRQQLALLDLFVKKEKPVLGICKGMQLICLYFGGGLIQHLETAEAHRYKECDQFHPTHAAPGSFLFHLYGSRFTVNSAHHQGICVPRSAYSARPAQPALLSGADAALLSDADAARLSDADATLLSGAGVVLPSGMDTARLSGADAAQSSGADASQGAGLLPPSAVSPFPLSVIQTADDGVPEGLIHKTLPIIGLQWHPERLCGQFARRDAADGSLVFRYFLSLMP